MTNVELKQNEAKQIPSALFNWLVVENKLSLPIIIQAAHDDFGRPVIVLKEAGK